MSIIAINKKHQTALNRAYKAYRAYHALVNLEDTCEPYSSELDRLMAKQERAYDKYLAIFDDLPARERVSFSNQHNTIHGYR